jgi:putative colanic acid biosysnthesis UDP-glucose lipid carrier transferase
VRKHNSPSSDLAVHDLAFHFPLPGQTDLNAAYPLFYPRNSILKRIFDVVFSSLVILTVLSWLLPILALFIKLSSRGPVFFKQERSGLHFRSFTCLKLRSMYLNDHADIAQASKNDPRITLAGKFLRKFSLDELPQFFNVFLGDMSLTGPRPHMTRHSREYSAQNSSFLTRHLVKPGITGLSQVQGFRGEINSPQMLRNRVRLDIFYIRKWSLAMEIFIILKTVKLILFGDKNAF